VPSGQTVDTERRSLTRPDGRVIEFLVAGPADGLPLVLHEGTPCGLVLYPPTVRAAAIRGLRVILAARPGYEGSTPRSGRRVVDVAQDTAAVLDDLGAGSFVTLGWSGGGPHALACAHGQWLAARIRGARVHLMPGEGHLSMTVSAFDRILDDLLDLAGLTA